MVERMRRRQPTVTYKADDGSKASIVGFEDAPSAEAWVSHLVEKYQLNPDRFSVRARRTFKVA